MIRRILNGIRRFISRGYQGAESDRLTAHTKPRNLSADSHALGPFGADSLRAWARQLVRDNAYAWGVVDTIVASVVGCGIRLESVLESQDGEDVEYINEAREKVWNEWCEVCDITGQYTFDELQQIAQREIVEAGECLIHYVTVPLELNGIRRPIPLALELIEADRIATDYDTYIARPDGKNRIVRGVELDELGTPVAYWVYEDNPNSPYKFVSQTPKRIDAKYIAHLYRRSRIGQSRGISWFAPVVGWLRDLGFYKDAEMKAAAVSANFTAAIKTETPLSGLAPPSGPPVADSSDADGNQYEFLQPGLIMNLRPGESVETINPGRPNSNSGPWIELILRGIAVGTGLSYETIARDYSQTNYSSNRASQLEDRRRFRQWQSYLVNHLCKRTWDEFCDAAALEGNLMFPSMQQLEDDRRRYAPADWHPPTWEWVDPTTEQAASENSIKANQSTYQTENGKRGANWVSVFKQRAKEERMRERYGLLSPDEMKAKAEMLKAEAALLTAKATQQNADTQTAQALEGMSNAEA